MSDSTTDQKRFNYLSWKLIEAKVLYYKYPGKDNITDAEYDRLEKEYLQSANKLGKENTVQNMVEIDMSRPIVQHMVWYHGLSDEEQKVYKQELQCQTLK